MIPMTRMMSALFVIGFVSIAVSAQAQDHAQAGAKVYAAQKCSMCHAIGGVGNKEGLLDGVGSKLSAEQIRQWIVDAPAMSVKAKADRKPAMKAYALGKEDLDGLV